MSDQDAKLMEFLEKALTSLRQDGVYNRIAISWIDKNGDPTTCYSGCTFRDLQALGQAFINEGILRLVAENSERIHRMEDEATNSDEE